MFELIKIFGSARSGDYRKAVHTLINLNHETPSNEL